ncbi:MAG: UbiD family decarboxylase, partial [Bacteroidia bacterium]|nr:UbiD family decarboxylase [Bacteroidia bacterium]
AVYPCTAVGIPPQEDGWIGKATERIFLAPIKMTVIPEVEDMELPAEGIFHNLTITKINKHYPGQAPKVTNAMWGAGQMMFNKIMIIVDGEINIHDYLDVAKLISKNVDPERDILFSQGPMDVLDHSCSKMGFGGKMSIDATTKLSEEIRSDNIEDIDVTGVNIDEQAIKAQFPGVLEINDKLLKENISCLIISVEKNRKNHIRELNASLFGLEEFKSIKIIIFMEHTLDVFDVADVIWRFTNNIDPRRDSFVVPAKDDHSISHIGIDGTRKTKEFDDFDRDWPNILVSSDETIEAVDNKWDKLGLGEFVKSPSLKYKSQLYKGGAIVEE